MYTYQNAAVFTYLSTLTPDNRTKAPKGRRREKRVSIFPFRGDLRKACGTISSPQKSCSC